MNRIKIGYGRFLAASKYRARKGLPADPKSSGPLTDDPDWSYIDGRPGQLNKGQSLRYLRDQEMATSMVKFMKQLNEMKKFSASPETKEKGPNDQFMK